jgi:hypothetical protein
MFWEVLTFPAIMFSQSLEIATLNVHVATANKVVRAELANLCTLRNNCETLLGTARSRPTAGELK